MQKIKIWKSPFFLVFFVMLFLLALSLVGSLLWGFISSIKSVDEFRLNIMGFPKSFAFSNYFVVLSKLKAQKLGSGGMTEEVGILGMLLNSLLYVLGCAFFSTATPCLMAYLNVKFKYRFNSVIYAVVLITMVLPIVGSLPSEIQVLQSLHLYDSMIGMWIQRSSFLGFYFLVFWAAFRTLPNEFAEAAYVDGCSEWTAMMRIMMPLVRNTFLLVMLIRGIEFWNDYQAPMLYIPSWPTLSLGIYGLTQTNLNEMSNVPMRMAGCFILVIPVLILFIAFHNKFIGNLSMGGIKE